MFNRGVLHDNMGDVSAALRCYKDLLRASLETGDVVGEALACNCIGVTLQMQGPAKLAEALTYHQQHLAVADVPGKFIAHSNLGLSFQVTTPRAGWGGTVWQEGCRPSADVKQKGPGVGYEMRESQCPSSPHPLPLQALGDMEEAATNHQQALRYAIRMSSLAGFVVHTTQQLCPRIGATVTLASRPTLCHRCPSGDADRLHPRTQGEPGVWPPWHGQPRGRRCRCQGLHGAAAAARAHAARPTRQG